MHALLLALYALFAPLGNSATVLPRTLLFDQSAFEVVTKIETTPL